MSTMPGFRMGGSGGWDIRGTAKARAFKSKAMAQVMFNDQELTAFMIDLKTEYPEEFKELIKKSVNETADFLVKKGQKYRRQYRNEIYSVIANSLDIKEISVGKRFGFRIYAAPEGQGPKGSRGIDSLVGLIQDKIPAWDYGFKNTQKKLPVESSEVYGNRTGSWAFPILLKAGRPAKFPGIGTDDFPTWDFTEDAKDSLEKDLEANIRNWLTEKFKTTAYKYRK